VDEDQIEEHSSEIEEGPTTDEMPEAIPVEGIGNSPGLRSRRKVVRTVAALAVVVAAGGAGIGIAVSSPSSSASTGAKAATGSFSGSGVPSSEGFNGGEGPPRGGEAFPAGGGRIAPTASGSVTVVDAASNTFTVKESSGTTVTVKVNSTTKYLDPGVSSASLADVVVGKDVAVIGTTSSGIVTATRVIIGFTGRPGGSGGMPAGEAPGGTS
jgi:hypothetical protein